MPKTTKKAKAAEPVSRLTWLPATVSQAEIAELLGISTRVVRDYVTRGIILSSPQPGRYLTIPSIHGYLTSLRNKAMGRASEDGPSLADERARNEAVVRQMNEIKLRQIQGEVLTLAEVAEQWSSLAQGVRLQVMSIPSKARSTIPHLTPHDAEVLRGICTDVLRQAAEDAEGVIGTEPKVLADAS